MDTERIFLGAIEKSTQDGNVVYIPCIYNSEFEKVVWKANYCNKSFEKAAHIAANLAELIEKDFDQFRETGKKNIELVMLLERTGTFDDDELSTFCDEDICKDCPEYKKCKDLEAEQIKKMN